MKKWLLILLFIPLLAKAQNKQYVFEKDSAGKYNLSYIHNFYNRTGDVVAFVAKEFLKNREDRLGEIVHDATNDRYITHISWNLKGYKKGCVSRAVVEAEVRIYYKDNRTKIEFSNFILRDVTGICKSGPIEELEASKCCETYQPILYKIGWKSYLISGEYKKFLRKKARDPNLF